MATASYVAKSSPWGGEIGPHLKREGWQWYRERKEGEIGNGFVMYCGVIWKFGKIWSSSACFYFMKKGQRGRRKNGDWCYFVCWILGQDVPLHLEFRAQGFTGVPREARKLWAQQRTWGQVTSSGVSLWSTNGAVVFSVVGLSVTSGLLQPRGL